MSSTHAMDWTDEGRRVGVTLDAFHAIVVVGTDAVATAEVALGIARVQAVHRRVALGDLLGEAAPLQALLTGDDPHGLVDSFLYGVSLTKIAQQVPEAGELFIMPTGTGPVDYAELFAHPRWRRLIAGFREVGALLIIAAPAEAASVDQLVSATDGAVIVGDAVPAEVSVAQSLAWIRQRRGAIASVARPAGDEASVDEAAAVPASTPSGSGTSRGRRAVLTALVVAALLALALFWYTRRASETRTASERMASDSAAREVAARARQGDSLARLRRDSLARDSAARSIAGSASADSFPILAPTNPADSAGAARFAILLSKYNTPSGAMLDLFGRFAKLPAATYGVETPSRFLLVVVGAYPTRASADSLLGQLRARRTLPAGFGNVEAYPLAFLVDSLVAPREVPARLARYAARGKPVYALRQADGTARLYFGAYASALQASLAVPQVRESGMVPMLVYRIGRVF